MTHIELGIYGEELAFNFLINKKVKIVDRNFRFKKNEIDLVGIQNNQLIIYEVKTRETAKIGEPYKAVTRTKQKQIIAVTDYYVKSKNIDLEVRFDVISIVHNSCKTNIEHIENAFFPT